MFSAHHPLASDCWQTQRQTQCSPRCAAKAGSVVVGVFSSHGATVGQSRTIRIHSTIDEDSYSMSTPKVLDACCGSRMFWFDRKDQRATFVDKRRERHTLPDVSSKGGSRELVIDPDHLADFTDLPFPDNTFALVVFDPPHFERNGATGWVGLKYGTLKGDWQEMLRGGFAECFRVLRPDGVLIFKWCEDEIPVSRILALTPEKPLFGHKSGKQQKTHWITFMKGGEA
jgi:SAM-dependent methyltransferase